MKILVIGDPHGTLPKELNKIVRKNKPKLIIVTGEIPPVPYEQFHPQYLKQKGKLGPSYSNKKYKELINKLCFYKIPVIVLKGNAYVHTKKGIKFVSKLFKKHGNLYYKKTGLIKINGRNFVLFDMIWEKWAYKWLNKKILLQLSKDNKKREKELNMLLGKLKNSILISHTPPYGYLDNVNKVGHVGSKVVLNAIKKHQPKYVFCGHIHEGKGKAKIGRTIVINAGCCGDYLIVNV